MKLIVISTVAHKGHAFSVEIYCCSVEIDLLRALPAVLRANLSLLRAKSVALYKHAKLLRTKIEISVENSMLLRTN